jgi:Carboxypeptidase regulatory-like domain
MSSNSGLISGIVLDTLGQPVVRARVSFVSGPVPLPDIAALTDDHGAFSLSTPVEGAYTIECVAEGFLSTKTTVTISQNKRANIEVRLWR